MSGIRDSAVANGSAVGSGGIGVGPFDVTTGDPICVQVCDPNPNITVEDDNGGGTSDYVEVDTFQEATPNVNRVRLWVRKNASGGSVTVTVKFTSGSGDPTCIAASGEGLTSDPVDTGSHAKGTDGSSPFQVTSAGQTQADNLMVLAVCSGETSHNSYVGSNGFTMVQEGTDDGLYWPGAFLVQDVSQTSAVTGGFTNSGASNTGLKIVALKEGATSTYEQEGFRFRNDDGSETTATWQQSQDVDTTHPLSTNLRLRALVNAGGGADPPSNAYTLRYKKSTDSLYIPVLTSQPSLSRSEITAGASTSNASTYATASVTLTAGRLYVMGIVTSDTASEQALSSVATTGGAISFSSLDSQTYDTVATNVHRLSVWYAQPTSTVTATITITPNDAATGCAWILQEYQNAADSPFGTPVKSGVDANTAVSATPGALTASSSHQIAFGAHDLNSTSDTASGTNWSSVGTGNAYNTPATGLECAENTSGSASQVTFSGAGSADRACIAVEIKVKVHPILVSASGNITAGGEDTTAQLTAPSGKSTSDFVTGRMWDNENGSDSIDLTTDDYTELEWSLIAASPAANGDIYQFRVYNGSAALNTYTVTPQWTIGSAGADAIPQAWVQYRTRRLH